MDEVRFPYRFEKLYFAAVGILTDDKVIRNPTIFMVIFSEMLQLFHISSLAPALLGIHKHAVGGTPTSKSGRLLVCDLVVFKA